MRDFHSQTPQRSCLKTISTKISTRISAKAVFELIDIRECFWPISFKKYLVLLFVVASVAAIAVTQHYLNWINQAMKISRSHMMSILVFNFGLESFMFTVHLLLAKVPRLSAFEERTPTHTAEAGDLEVQINPSAYSTSYQTALIVPCHNSNHQALRKLVHSAVRHFRPQDIFIVENGPSMHPANNDLREFITNLHKDIVYIWSPIPSKNAAQLVGSLAARNYDYILTVDDDVLIPPQYQAPTAMIDDMTKAVAFPIHAIDAHGNCPLFMVAWQDCEYRILGMKRLAESSTCGALFPHGAGWFVERNTFIEMLTEHHPMDFVAEDGNAGLCFLKMGKRLVYDAGIILNTEAPTTLFGPGLNWCKQRIKVWEMGRHAVTMKLAGRLFLSMNGQTDIKGIIMQKGSLLYYIANNLMDYIRLPLFVSLCPLPTFWKLVLPLSLLPTFHLLTYNYVKCYHRPDMRCSFLAAITFPFYMVLYRLVSVLGLLRYILYYLGGHQMPKKIQSMIDEQDERCFWLDHRFETNPAFLADA